MNPAISNMKGLRSLNISGNDIKYLPHSLVKLKNHLVKLELDWPNYLTPSRPTTFTQHDLVYSGNVSKIGLSDRKGRDRIEIKLNLFFDYIQHAGVYGYYLESFLKDFKALSKNGTLPLALLNDTMNFEDQSLFSYIVNQNPDLLDLKLNETSKFDSPTNNNRDSLHTSNIASNISNLGVCRSPISPYIQHPQFSRLKSGFKFDILKTIV